MVFNGESGRLYVSRTAWTYRLSQFCTGNMTVERFSILTVFVQRMSEASLPPWRRSFQQSRQLHSRLSPLGTFGSKEAFIVGVANRLPTLLSGSLLVFQSGKQLDCIRFHPTS